MSFLSEYPDPYIIAWIRTHPRRGGDVYGSGRCSLEEGLLRRVRAELHAERIPLLAHEEGSQQDRIQINNSFSQGCILTSGYRSVAAAWYLLGTKIILRESHLFLFV